MNYVAINGSGLFLKLVEVSSHSVRATYDARWGKLQEAATFTQESLDAVNWKNPSTKPTDYFFLPVRLLSAKTLEGTPGNKELEQQLSAAQQDAAFYRCCALSGEVPEEGAEPSANQQEVGV